MVQTRHFKTKRSGGQSQDTSDLTTDEANSSRSPTPSGSASGASVSDASAWMLRFSNDNAYASFCRNAYLSVIVAFTVILDETPVIFAREVSMCEYC
ncbi:hypothetical protein LSAT2_031983 [Lamellibrachia satsuma]|nr:hypothetical protein LSAT2_031983 [Lamellibrachia satsuma]